MDASNECTKALPARAAMAAAALLAALAVSSCNLAAIGQPELSRAKDSTAPVVAITTPSDGYSCANVVFVSGSVADKVNDGGKGLVTSLSYEVPGSGVAGTIVPKDDGSFSFSFPTNTLGNGGFSLVVKAMDWNSNESLSRVNLQKSAASSLPSFKVVAGSQSVVLTWDEVDQTESYDLYYTDNGSQPASAPSITDIASPYTMKCTNGNLYVFRLKAKAKAGFADSYSDYLMAIPLSVQTLTPSIYGGRRRIDLSWNGIAATNEFTIYRRIGDTGSFDEFRNVTGTSFADQTVQDGRCYYYKVRPRDNCEILSAAAGGQTDGFMNDSSKESRYAIDDRDIVWNGSFMYAASYTKGLKVYDATDTANPALLRTISLPTGARAYQIVLSGGHAYVAAGTAGLLIYSLASPGVPTLVATYKGDIACARGVAVSGTTVLVADFSYTNGSSSATYDSSVKVLEVGDSSSPTPAAVKSFRLDLPANTVNSGYIFSEDLGPLGIEIVGSYALVSDRGSGLKIVNFVDGLDGAGPGQTLSVNDVYASASAERNAMAVTVCGSYAYVAFNNYGIMTVDVSGLAAGGSGTATIKYCDDYGANGRVQDVKAAGDWIYAANFLKGIQVYKQDTGLASTLEPVSSTPADYPTYVRAKGAVTFATTGLSYYGAYMQNVIDVNLPVELRKVTQVGMSQGAACLDVAIDGDYAFVAAGIAGLRIYDISNPEAPVEIGHKSLPGYNACEVKLAGGMAAVAAKDSGGYGQVFIVDVTDPAKPVAYGTPISASYYRGMALSGNYFYLADFYLGIQIHDISTPPSSYGNSVVKRIETENSIGDISIKGNYLFATRSSGSVGVYDIFNPLEAYRCSSVEIPASGKAITNQKGLFTAFREGSVYSCEVSDPLNPSTPVAFTPPVRAGGSGAPFDKEWLPKGLAQTGNYLFAFLFPSDHYPNNGGRIEIIDVSRPAKPSEFHSFDFPLPTYESWSNDSAWSQTNGLAVSGAYLYLAFGDKGLYVYKIRP